MAQNNDVRTFVKESLRRYYRYQQYKMKDNPNPETDLNLAVKIDNNLLYVNGVGGYNGDGIVNSETTRPISAVIADAANVSINDNICSSLFVWSSLKTSNTINASISNYTYNKNHIDAIENTANNVSTTLNNVSTRLNDTNTTLNNVSTKLNNVSTRLNDTNTTLNNVSTRLNDTNITLNNESTRLNDVSNRLYNTNTKLNNVSTKLDSFKGSQNISINNGTITALGYNLNNNGFAIFDGYASGTNSVASGYTETNGMIKASAEGAHAHGYAAGNSTIAAQKDGAHAEGSAAIGSGIYASYDGAHAEGRSLNNSSIISSGSGAHAEGCAVSKASIEARGDGAHAEGYAQVNSYIIASGLGAHAEGYALANSSIEARGDGAHAEGVTTKATASASHAEGHCTTASAYGAHAGGCLTIASGYYSCAIGKYTEANMQAQFICGTYNKNTTAIFAVGVGTSSSDKLNGLEVNKSVYNSASAIVNGVSGVTLGAPIGTMVVWSGSTTSNPPAGWLLCNGKVIVTLGTNSYSETIGRFNSYLNLLNTIGTAYGCDKGYGSTMSTVDGGSYKVSSSESFVKIPNATVSIGGVTKRYIIKYF